MIQFKKKYMNGLTFREKKQLQSIERESEAYCKQVQVFLAKDSPTIFGNWTHYFCYAEFKYLLNQIRLNDPSLERIDLCSFDDLNGTSKNSDDGAFKIAEALKTNTHCVHFMLTECNFSDNGVMAILKALDKHTVEYANFSQNFITQKSKDLYENLAKKNKDLWKNIELGTLGNKQPVVSEKKTFLAELLQKISKQKENG